jgi:hypothetical protein
LQEYFLQKLAVEQAVWFHQGVWAPESLGPN